LPSCKGAEFLGLSSQQADASLVSSEMKWNRQTTLPAVSERPANHNKLADFREWGLIVARIVCGSNGEDKARVYLVKTKSATPSDNSNTLIAV
jgi:hypothetical protein